jgi:DNA invertase Pin-like site-specific DNA recombinase
LSLVTENTTSPERQLEKITQYAALGDHGLVPITEADYDLDVSGAVSPFDRPGLGPWLREDRLGTWDALCAAKLDRVSRSLFDFTALLSWLEAHDKTLIILDPMMELTKPEGRVMAHMLMTFAQYEREVIGARVKDAHDKLVRDGKYTGGMVPFGYMPVKLAKNFGYSPDPEYAPLVVEMAERFLRGETLGGIARWLRDLGVPSPKNVIRKRNGKPLTDTPWSPSVVRMILQSPAVLGAVADTRGTPLRDAGGFVVYRSEPLISREVYEAIQARLALNVAPVKVNTSPLLRVLFCTCGAPMHATTTRRSENGKGYSYRYYHCHSSHLRDGKCSAPRINADRLEEAVFGALLDNAGWYELTEKKVIPGRDHAEDIARLAEVIGHLSSKIATGRATRQDVSADKTALQRAEDELDRIAALEPEPARVRSVKTGKTLRARLEELDVPGRNQFLQSAGVRAVAHKDQLPPMPGMSGPMTPLDISRTAIITEDALNVVVDLGNLRDILARADEAL